MTNRTVLIEIKNKPLEITNCLDMFEGEDFSKVERNKFLLSVIRKVD